MNFLQIIKTIYLPAHHLDLEFAQLSLLIYTQYSDIGSLKI